MSIASVRHLTKDHIRITPAAGYSVTVFNVHNGKIEAIVSADDGSETIRLLIEAPAPGKAVALEVEGTVVDIIYKDAPNAV